VDTDTVQIDSVEASSHSPFLSRYRSGALSFQLRYADTLLPIFLDELLKQALTPEILEGGTLHNVTGGQGTDSSDLLRIEGRCWEEEDTDEDPPTTFRLRLATSFLKSTPDGDVTYSISMEREGSYPKDLPISVAGRAFPLRVEQVSLDISFLRKSFISASFGLAPSVSARIILDLTPSYATFQFSDQSMSSAEEVPCTGFPLGQTIHRLMNQVFHLSTEDLYVSSLKDLANS
jgi:hypothetical protein